MAKKKEETEVEETNEELVVVPTFKVAPLDLNLAGQLGQENLTLVIAKLNEVIEYINK